MKKVTPAKELDDEKGQNNISSSNVGRKKVPDQLFRNAFKMKLKPGFRAEYKRRHDEIWPELIQVLKNAGISDYSIYLDEKTDTLFAVQKLTAGNTAGDLPNNPIVQRWWDYMSDLMEYTPNHTPIAISLSEMFHMD
jgi:L-rhamnose mutarotase